MTRRHFFALAAVAVIAGGCRRPDYGAGVRSGRHRVRLLCIKHSREHMADGDATLAIRAAKAAADLGLDIRVVGNHFVDGRMMAGGGEAEGDLVPRLYTVETVTAYLNQYVRAESAPGDTLIVFTIGHGSPNGELHNIGQRADVQRTIAGVAEAHGQRIFWWQLSCYASANLPEIDTLTPRQKELFSRFASSSATEPSYANIQGGLMAKVFNELATNGKRLDTDGDGRVTRAEMASFMSTLKPDWGGRVQAKDNAAVIFGSGVSTSLPIRDRNNPQGQYPDDYVKDPFAR